jgi:tRNA A37 methylthiotransferase MiaB
VGYCVFKEGSQGFGESGNQGDDNFSFSPAPPIPHSPDSPIVQVINFGCRLNIYEGEVIKQQAAAAGIDNALVFNSCAVTAEAERQVRQAIRKARKENPSAKIIVTGCGAQINPQQYAEMEEVDSVDR